MNVSRSVSSICTFGLSHADNISLPSQSHTAVLSGNIFPQIVALCSLLTASLVNKARTMSCRTGKGEAEEWTRERESKRRHTTEKPGLPLLIGRLKRTSLKAGAHVGCCHGTHQGDGSLLPKMALLLYWAVQWRLIWVVLLPSWVWSCSPVLPAPFICSSLHSQTDSEQGAKLSFIYAELLNLGCFKILFMSHLCFIKMSNSCFYYFLNQASILGKWGDMTWMLRGKK